MNNATQSVSSTTARRSQISEINSESNFSNNKNAQNNENLKSVSSRIEHGVYAGKTLDEALRMVTEEQRDRAKPTLQRSINKISELIEQLNERRFKQEANLKVQTENLIGEAEFLISDLQSTIDQHMEIVATLNTRITETKQDLKINLAKIEEIVKSEISNIDSMVEAYTLAQNRLTKS